MLASLPPFIPGIYTRQLDYLYGSAGGSGCSSRLGYTYATLLHSPQPTIEFPFDAQREAAA
ncbi:hypothetical protein N7489_004739 [Penicillium chrysogenum]|uniref:uncharacterized protein n=1 Tax=Penicillium chrysogenum TaxID=5076 RepID=UPI0024DF1452|nr:uncharacterized protein N7489_004739 [Penicillium chrysogenum]KAJ5244643.1 hypothetical protein N7489_004739 [Penicillium chrysogenum]KAJ5849028.1 hypothetical protein N7534_008346 [Penicillium rubens]